MTLNYSRLDFGTHDEKPELCCSESQIDDLLQNFGPAAALLERCPTCYYNFRMNFCDMTCRPDQNKFLKPKVINGTYDGCSASGNKLKNSYQRKPFP